MKNKTKSTEYAEQIIGANIVKMPIVFKKKRLENITSSEDKWKKLLSDIPKTPSFLLQEPHETNEEYSLRIQEYNSIYNK